MIGFRSDRPAREGSGEGREGQSVPKQTDDREEWRHDLLDDGIWEGSDVDLAGVGEEEKRESVEFEIQGKPEAGSKPSGRRLTFIPPPPMTSRFSHVAATCPSSRSSRKRTHGADQVIEKEKGGERQRGSFPRLARREERRERGSDKHGYGPLCS
jgi:hypothetical protein